MHVTKLRVAGFKSFVEPTELHIERGLTGIVGPNGCGKSNLVEALRWVMGETAPRQVRGGGMEDVIFGGTSRRPAHAIAEATLSLDNSDRTAPPGFEDAAEIEVTRRIERGEGSAYTVNGDEVRARDVHILFADAATGAHSSALVGQGRIGDIIGAKPAQRRALLEEAAGITGLHARRHEAELKLRAAETNLERLQDVIGTLEAQLRDLERQARHAKRYRRLSERIRETEAALLLVRWMAARTRVEEVTRQAEDAARRVAQATEACRRCRAPPGGHCRGAARAAPTRNRTGRRPATAAHRARSAGRGGAAARSRSRTDCGQTRPDRRRHRARGGACRRRRGYKAPSGRSARGTCPRGRGRCRCRGGSTSRSGRGACRGRGGRAAPSRARPGPRQGRGGARGPRHADRRGTEPAHSGSNTILRRRRRSAPRWSRTFPPAIA